MSTSNTLFHVRFWLLLSSNCVTLFYTDLFVSIPLQFSKMFVSYGSVQRVFHLDYFYLLLFPSSFWLLLLLWTEGRRLQIWPCFTVKFICMRAYLLREHFTTFLDVCEQFAQNIKRPWGAEYESPPVLNARTDDSAAWAGFLAKTLPISKSNSDIMLHIDVIHQELCCPVCQIWKFRIP